MPMLVAIAIGESLWPKQTGHASAARGARKQRRDSVADRLVRIVYSCLVFR